MAFTTLRYELADSGVAHIVIDVSGHKHNVITPELHREIGEVARQLAADDNARGAVLRSGKATFMAGGDLKRIAAYYEQRRSARQAYEESRPFTESLRALETCGKPVAAAINGTALGGGLELALACHHRVCLADERIQLGLPEVTLGLIPGAGGTQRLPRMIGIRKAAGLILSGKRLNPAEALETGIVDELVPAEQLVAAAEQWVLGCDDATQPWDRRGFRVPGGAGISDPRVGGLFIQLTAEVSAEHRHNYPAPIAALRAVFNGTTLGSMDAALKVETREFSALTRDPVARNIIRTLFINRGKTPGEGEPAEAGEGAARLCEALREAYIDEGRRMAREGIPAALIDNVAFGAGMPTGPLALAGETGTLDAPGGATPATGDIRERLLCIQALAAAQYWAQGLIDPVDADRVSVLEWSFPSYTGGVMSYMDTLGLSAFTARCDALADRYGDRFRPGAWLRDKAREGDRIY